MRKEFSRFEKFLADIEKNLRDIRSNRHEHHSTCHELTFFFRDIDWVEAGPQFSRRRHQSAPGMHDRLARVSSRVFFWPVACEMSQAGVPFERLWLAMPARLRGSCTDCAR